MSVNPLQQSQGLGLSASAEGEVSPLQQSMQRAMPADSAVSGQTDYFQQLARQLADFWQTHPAVTNSQLDQEITRLSQESQPPRTLTLNQRQLIAGYANASSDGALNGLRVGYVAQNQFLLDWSNDIFKKPDDEENQW
jgi:hypothetical protein